MIDIVKLLNGNVAIYDNSSGDFIFSMSPAIIEMQCSTNGTIKVVQNNENFEFFDPAQIANTQVLPAAAIPFVGTCADLADILATDFFFELTGDDLASILSNGNNAGANDIDMNGNDILNVTNINGSPYPPTSLGTVTSVGLTMPTAFNVANSPITSAGTINVTGAGLTSQYIRGDGSLANFPTNVGGGSSISYYLNGSINQGTFGGNVYHQMSKTAILGGGTNFTINANGYIAQFLTNAGDPALLNIPAGNWDFQIYFSASSAGGSPQFYTELYKYDGTIFTLIASGSTSPQNITNGTFTDLYISNLTVPQTTLTLTDRLAVRVYVIHSGRIITMYTEDNKLAEVHTTFSTGIAALNGLTDQIQNFSTGTSGTDFNISSSSATHTFNIPTASALNRGLLSTTDWSAFNGKQNALGYTPVPETRTLTINGSTQDLSANRTFTIANPEGWTVIIKSANQDVTNNATPQDDTELQFSVVAGGHYMVELNICYSGNDPAGDYLWIFRLSTGLMRAHGIAQNFSTTGSPASNQAVTANNAIQTGNVACGVNVGNLDNLHTTTCMFNFYVDSNAILKFQFSNNLAAAGRTSRTWKGSILKYKRID